MQSWILRQKNTAIETALKGRSNTCL